MKKYTPVAVLLSDLHIRTTTPRSRAEPDWLEVQANYFAQVQQIMRKHGDIPCIVAGDVFDSGWNAEKCPPSLINFAFDHLPRPIYAIPGQHDLPNHRLDLMERSAFWTLWKGGLLNYLNPFDTPTTLGNATFWGFPWGVEIMPPEGGPREGLKVAIIHAYVWNAAETKHKDAKPTDYVAHYRRKMKDYDVVLSGDNHSAWLSHAKKPIWFNHGGFINRNSDERGEIRSIGILMSDGSVKLERLDTSKDKWREVEELLTDPAVRMDSEEFLKDLSDCGGEFFDFCSSVLKHLRKKEVRQEVQQLVTQILKKAKES